MEWDNNEWWPRSVYRNVGRPARWVDDIINAAGPKCVRIVWHSDGWYIQTKIGLHLAVGRVKCR